MKKIIILLFAGFIGLAVHAAPTVTDVVAKQRYPWNGLVDITCKVEGLDETTKEFEFYASAIVSDLGITNRLSHFWVIKDGNKSTDKTIKANGNYHLLWDAKADLGKVRYTNMVVRVNVNIYRVRVQLWEGGPYWATTNIGAEKPEDYGYYFWWGDTVGYKRENHMWVASDGSNSNFSFSSNNTPTSNKSISTLQSEGWIVLKDGTYVLTPEHDAAQVQWGGDWRMPTKQEFDDLNSKCDWTWTPLNGVNGYVIRGRGDYASNSIFLPLAGNVHGFTHNNPGLNGNYWSSVPDSDSDSSWDFDFGSGNNSTHYISLRFLGQSVRPLQGFTK